MRLIIDQDHNVKKINRKDTEKFIEIGMKITLSGSQSICIICNNEEEAAKKEMDKIICSNC